MHLEDIASALFTMALALAFTAIACVIFVVAYHLATRPEIMSAPHTVCMGPGK